MLVSMITTTDNPWDPFDNWEEWLAFDEQKSNLTHQYFNCSCCEFLDRHSFESSNMPPAYAQDENERAIDDICNKYWMFHIFKKVQKEVA